MVDLDEWIFLIIALLCRISELLAATVHRSVREKSLRSGGSHSLKRFWIEIMVNLDEWIFLIIALLCRISDLLAAIVHRSVERNR
ncbi:hypothetical protein CEXT_578981 [Caerostris extrusa]|uniref:Uncharacterized protein n=1 Tax=Caerostris extrusa TaxID=172846 RepID=A0AAV4VC11_CAEEX|nr:hypothetical protein CEXT_578981 [Caerostris extrusa]